MAGINRTTGKATDLITFSRASGGTALRKISYGSELVTNGDFETALGDEWTSASAGVIAAIGGKGIITTLNGDTAGGATQSVTVESGKVYQVSWDVDAYTGSGWQVQLGDGISINAYYDSGIQATTGTFSAILKATTTTVRVTAYARSNGVGDQTTTFDNISVKEVLFDQPDGTLTLFNHPNNIPRIEYAADGTVKGLLIEEQRENLNTNSSVFSSGWGLTNATADDNVVVSPDGTVNAAEYEHTNSLSQISKTFAVTTSTTYTASVFLKANTNTWVRFAGGGVIGAWFNVAEGNVGTREAQNVDAKIEPYGNGWYRCSITFVAGSTSITLLFGNQTADGSTTEATGVTGYVYGFQLEAGSFPTSYMPTSGSPATRAADIASIPVTDFGYNQKAGTVVVEASVKSGGDSRGIASLVESGISENIALFRSTAGNIVYEVRSSNTSQTNLSLSSGTDLLTAAYTFSKDNFNLVVNGTAATPDTSGTVPDGITEMSIGGVYGGVSFPLNGHIKSLSYYPRKLSDTQLQELTA